MDQSSEEVPTIQPQAPVARDTTSIGQEQQAQGEHDEAWLKQYSCVYFGYSSNLSPRTMKQRCPDSLFISLARISGWRWIINETGYANIIPSTADDEVWGSLCFLSRRDEMALDESEGVPWLYEKVKLKVKRVPQEIAGEEWRTDDAAEEVEATAYVDVQRLTEGRIEKEYITWVRKSLEDAKLCGLPDSYADKYIRKFLPAKTDDDLPEQEVMMVRTMQFGEKGAGLVPRGFASWSRG